MLSLRSTLDRQVKQREDRSDCGDCSTDDHKQGSKETLAQQRPTSHEQQTKPEKAEPEDCELSPSVTLNSVAEEKWL
jgi:hypothetical protein